ncbi:ATPase [Aureibaculum sp. 2210JD6-5]|uniref:ATPase n=1 Tax=Aureibaculum sp. 2210JD6-5 TaxID=3103957 RepID=UPI002AADDB05|nr:ATPase [Aureibaculum sp. 2210JD6-5]MDY7397027.1 ATPase [Aureibaculum sp. 2210JD6-5]
MNLYKIKEPENEYILGILKGEHIHYDFEKVLNFLETKGKLCYGNHFKLDQADKYIIYKLVIYIIGDEHSCLANNMDINKGILLTGPIGCGKTSLMNLVKFLLPIKKRYKIIPARNVSYDFYKKGYETVIQNSIAGRYCFDDLGVERYVKHYGNECNVLGEILLSRYDLWVQKKVITHATTNLNANELETWYGIRVRSRLREMFNLIAFDTSSKDKRK